MRIEVRAAHDLTAADRTKLAALDQLANPPGPATSVRLTWAGREDAPFTVLVWDAADRLISSATICQRSILLNGQPVQAGGIRGVMTHPDARRQGYGRAAMQTATGFLWQHFAPELALLLSSTMAVPFYLSLGWHVFEGMVLCAQPSGIINYTERRPNQPAMLRLPGDQPPPRGTIDLCGLPW